jgi:hypothetical protein
MSDPIKELLIAQVDALIAQMAQCQRFVDQYKRYCLGVAGAARDHGAIDLEMMMNVDEYGEAASMHYDMLMKTLSDIKGSIELI